MMKWLAEVIYGHLLDREKDDGVHAGRQCTHTASPATDRVGLITAGKPKAGKPAECVPEQRMPEMQEHGILGRPEDGAILDYLDEILRVKNNLWQWPEAAIICVEAQSIVD